MKKIVLLVVFVWIGIASTSAQDAKQEQTKMDAFASKTGVIIKFQDYSLPSLKLLYGISETSIRKVSSGGEPKYFYRIEKKNEYDTKVASIEYSDLKEVVKAFDALKEAELKDLALNPDYLENKFSTEDGFQLGYYVSKGKSTWYMRLEKFGSKNTIFLTKEIIEDGLNNAMAKMKELNAN